MLSGENIFFSIELDDDDVVCRWLDESWEAHEQQRWYNLPMNGT